MSRVGQVCDTCFHEILFGGVEGFDDAREAIFSEEVKHGGALRFGQGIDGEAYLVDGKQFESEPQEFGKDIGKRGNFVAVADDRGTWSIVHGKIQTVRHAGVKAQGEPWLERYWIGMRARAGVQVSTKLLSCLERLG